MIGEKHLACPGKYLSSYIPNTCFWWESRLRHDVSMQMVGQPARDLARHFIQRWNHLLRIKVKSLIPLTTLILTGIIEPFSSNAFPSSPSWIPSIRIEYIGPYRNLWAPNMSICRSLVNGYSRTNRVLYPERLSQRWVHNCNWCNQTDADAKIAIQLSDHFVYIENQFFITS